MADTRVLYVRLPADLHKRLRVTAAKRGEHMSELVREAVERFLEGSKAND